VFLSPWHPDISQDPEQTEKHEAYMKSVKLAKKHEACKKSTKLKWTRETRQETLGTKTLSFGRNVPKLKGSRLMQHKN